jgi:beta-glucosidase
MKANKKRYLTILGFFLCIMAANAVDPYLDTTLPVNTRVKDLVSKMTLVEKITQLGHVSPAISRLGVKSYNYWNEGLHGVARQGIATSFPQPYGLAATWDSTLIYNIATVISDEARVRNNVSGQGLTYWCPVVNMDRDPRWGREEENFGEDNYLAGRLAVNYIKGMQGNDPKYFKTVATAKHFACNNVEQGRTSTSSNVDERSLREYFLPVFKACVQEGKAYSIMSAYNAINGVPCPANRTLLTNILRNEWGFKGFVVSDCDAVSDVSVNHKYVPTLTDGTTVSLRSGTDLNCQYTYQNYTNDAITKGLLKEEDIDSALVRVFKARFLLGEFDASSMVSYTSIPKTALDCQANRDLALLSAQKAIVLLKNQNSFLPLKKDSINSIAVIGPNANVVSLGEYSGAPIVQVSPLRGIADKLGIDVTGGIIEAESFDTCYIKQTKTVQSTGSIVYVGYLQNNYYLGFYNREYPLTIDKLDMNISTIYAGTVVEVYLDAVDGTGTKIGTAIIPNTADWNTFQKLTIDVTPFTGIHNIYFKCLKGTSTSTKYLFNIDWFKFYNSANASTVSADTYSAGNKTIYYAPGATVNGALDQAAIDKAVNYAKQSDVAVLFCGTDVNTGSEGSDRTDITLPGSQEALIKAVYAANPKTILVLVNGFSLAVNWEQDNLPAIMSAWFDGQAQGTAIADVLFGDYNPGGKLASTWYKSISDIPSKYDYNIRNNRTYMYFKGTPLYPFGYGLSYTTFSYSNLAVSASSLSPGNSIVVTADITNSGSKAGDEVAQLYINIPSTMVRPIKQLKGFTRVTLQPGETKHVSFTLKYEDLQYYDVVSRTFKVEAGSVNLSLGSSSQDIRLNTTVNATAGTVSSTYRQNPYSQIEAEDYENKTSSVMIKSCSEGGLCIDSLLNSSNVVYKNMNFDKSALKFKARQASLMSNGSISIVMDSISGPVAGTLTLTNTGNITSFVTDSCALNEIKGVHDVYLVFKGGTALAGTRLNWFTFQAKDSVANGLVDTKENAGYKFSVFPNPVKTDFLINYTLPTTSDVKIDIYTIEGSLFKSMIQKNQSGDNQLKINANVERMAAGIYVVRLTADKYTKSVLLNINN